MTAPDRLEPQLPALFTELAAARVPDYFDDMLRQTAAATQRPAWRSLERWLPMDVAVRPAASRLPAWQPVLLLALVVLAVVAAAAVLGGSRQRTLPPPFGPAVNGPIYFSTAEGDILAVDTPTGPARTVIGDAAHDEGPWFSPRGDRLLFARIEATGPRLMVADSDGGGVRDVTPSTGLGDWVDWSPDGDRIALTPPVSRPYPGIVTIVAVRDGREQSFEMDGRVRWLGWRPDHEELVLLGGVSGEDRIWLVDPNGTILRTFTPPVGIVGHPTLSPDGDRIAYATWSGEDRLKGRIRVLDLSSGAETLLTPNLDDGLERLAPQFSPDGSSLLLERYTRDDVYTMAILAADGSGEETPLGPPHPQGTDGAAATFSPDGSAVLVTYRDDRTTWLLPVDGGAPTQTALATPGFLSWQRLAP